MNQEKNQFHEYVFNTESRKCQTCQDLKDALPDVNIHRMLFDVLANKEYEQYLKLSWWGKFKYKLRQLWRRIRGKPTIKWVIHPNCRCYLKEVKEG